MGFWESIRGIFRKQEDKTLEERFDEDELEYTGYEPDCWACGMSIHKSQISRKLNGKRMHRFCFRKIKKIAMNGGNIDEFSN